jgi:c-di-GMP-binding flagellar brake protein YcgR
MENRQVPRAKLKWQVVIKNGKSSMNGVTHDLSPNGTYIRCAKPLRLHEVFDIVIEVPNSDRPINANVEVVWSNIYGPDDNINPRGMGVRFITISGEDRKVIAKAVMQQLKLAKEEIHPKLLKTMENLIIEKDQTPTEADSVAS